MAYLSIIVHFLLYHKTLFTVNNYFSFFLDIFRHMWYHTPLFNNIRGSRSQLASAAPHIPLIPGRYARKLFRVIISG